MKSPRKIFFVTVAALSVTAAIVIQSFNLAAGRHLESVQQELGRLLGRNIRFASLQVHLLGWPGFAAKELRIADDPRFAATPILRARELILGVQLWQLLFGRVVIDSLTLRAPEFQIITDETGLFNLDLLTQKRKEMPRLPQLRSAPAERKTSSVSFAINALRIDDGRVIYLDRSVKEPAELQLGDIDLTLRGLEGKKTTRFRFAAALAEGLGQDVRIDGEFNATAVEQSWLRREMNLTIRLDSLHVPVVARAVTALRDKIPRGLDVTGPMSLQAQATGTLARPKFENITLRASVFGSSDYNATVTGGVKFSERRSWEDAELNGNLTVDPLPLGRLRNLSWFRQNLAPALVTDGAVGLYARFEGTWETLRVGALVRADKSEWKFPDWLRKALGRPAEIKARFARQKDKLFFHESEFASGPNRIGFLGFVDVGDEPKLQLRLYSRQGRLHEWREMILPELLAGATGRSDLNIVIDRHLLPDDGSWSVYGYLKLTDGEFKQPHGGRTVESANATITFSGRQAKFENAKFRLGTSTFEMNGAVANILDPNAVYQLRAPQLNLADLKMLGGGPAIQLKNFSAKGAAQFHNGALVLEGAALSPEGRIADIDFRDLRADIIWSATGMTFKNLSLRALDGNLRADGYFASSADNSGQFELSTQADSIAMRALLARLLPAVQDRVQGQLGGRGQFALTTTHGTDGQNALKGSGEAAVQHGVIKDFNLVSQLLLRGSGATASAQSTARLPPGFAKLLSRTDTVFDSLQANFIVEPERIRTDNLVILTPDYMVTGAGWIGFDRTTKWNGLIVLSPRLTQEVQRDVRLLRYLLDRRGRLTITFRVDGTIPNVRIRLDNRALAQTLRGGAPARDGEREAASRPSKESSADKKWLPDALERFLNR
jgi:hypothetical protein